MVDALTVHRGRSWSSLKPQRGLRATISFSTSITPRLRSMLDLGLQHHAVRDSHATLQVLPIDAPYTFTSTSAARYFANRSAAFGTEEP
jgi:hypothetical protein